MFRQRAASNGKLIHCDRARAERFGPHSAVNLASEFSDRKTGAMHPHKPGEQQNGQDRANRCGWHFFGRCELFPV
jgi:hypothetical protein